VPESQEQIIVALSPYLLFAEANNQVIWFISGSIHSSEGIVVIPEGESYLEVDSLYISPECRRQGIGLITQAIFITPPV
jgi:ribosomal protein S18 acetylase RimI-like enzyme